MKSNMFKKSKAESINNFAKIPYGNWDDPINIKDNSLKCVLFLCLLVFSFQFTQAQDSTEVSLRRNTIKYDLTSNLLYRNSITFSFERIVKPNQSFVVTAGVQEFPNLLDLGQDVSVTKEGARSGHKIGGEYRFYLKKENKFSAPRGVYIGPYFTSLGFKIDDRIVYNGGEEPEEANLKARLNIFSIGAQLGYQFVFNDRWTLDLVLVGPSYSRYNFNVNLDGDFEFDPENVQNEIFKALLDRFPLLEEVINDKELNSSGTLNTWALGYKYQFLVGYRFGKYKNMKKK